ncbi:MAG: putative transposase [Candidatus Azotimanducaceae bacterium]|jgi:putative transposase
MDEPHLDATVKYVELNPVKAKLCKNPQGWRWSSVHAHLNAEDDGLVSVRPMLEKFPNWGEYLEQTESENEMQRIQMHTRTGRPLSSNVLVGNA